MTGSPRFDRTASGLTTRGRCLLAGGVAALVCALLLDERDLLRIGLLAVILPLIAAVAGRVPRSGVTITRQVLPDRLQPSATGVVHLHISNRSTRRSAAIEIIDRPVPGLTEGTAVPLAPLAPGSSQVVSYPLRATVRGRFSFPDLVLRRADPFGLWQADRRIPSDTVVLVVPRTVPLLAVPAAPGTRSVQSGTAAPGSAGGDPDVQVRPYVPGDDIRTVHWRASARRDDLVVRLRESVPHGAVTVLVDGRGAAHRGSGAAASLETAITLAASVSLHLLGADYHLTLLDHAGEVIAAGHDITDDILAGLADITADDGVDLTARAVGRPGLLVAILGQLDEPTAHALAAARWPSARGIALVLDVPRWGAANDGAETSDPVTATRAAAILRSGGWHAVVVEPDSDLAAIWAAACGRDATMAGLPARQATP